MAFKAKISKRIRRLFDHGHLMEDYMVNDLNAIGIKVFRRQEEIVDCFGHWKGHMDGIALGVPMAEKTEHLLEMKTMNDDQFKMLVKAQNVLKSHPKHFWQANTYMGKYKLKRALYMSYNKNDSQYYVERLYFDKEKFEEAEHKEMAVITEHELYPQIGTKKETWHECKFCDARKICFKKEQPAINCRTCQFVEVKPNGVWACGKNKGKVMSLEAQAIACKLYKLDEVLE